MNIAVCLSGLMDNSNASLNSIKNIIPNENIKIFIHTWEIDNSQQYLNDTPFPDNHLDKNEVKREQDLNIKKYNAEKILIENYTKTRRLFQKIYEKLKRDPNPPKYIGYERHDVGIISMWYSILKANQLKCNYEKNNNIIFDKVIRMRFDTDFFNVDLVLDNNINSIQIPLGNNWGGICDQFAIGPSDEMNHYSNLFAHLLKMENIYYHPETLLKKYLDTFPTKNPIDRFSFNVGINGVSESESNKLRVSF